MKRFYTYFVSGMRQVPSSRLPVSSLPEGSFLMSGTKSIDDS